MRHVVWGTRSTEAHGHASRGFSLIELLVTVLLAGIIFLAMVPLFVSVLKRTSTDSRRVIATNVAQARIETIRELAATLGPTPTSTTQALGYAAITTANLNSSTWNPTLISPTFVPAHGGTPYNVNTTVTWTPSANPTPAYKTVTVTVSRPGDAFSTQVSTVIMNPVPITSTSTSGPVDPNGPHSLTVSFKNWQEVKGVKVVYVNTSPTPNVTTTATPTSKVPSASNTTCVWTNLPGGLSYLYTVTCTPQSPSSWGSPLVGESTHLLSDGFMHFDTNPGGS